MLLVGRPAQGYWVMSVSALPAGPVLMIMDRRSPPKAAAGPRSSSRHLS